MGSRRTVLSVFLPGLGHIVLGRTVAGVSILAAWVTCAIWLTLMKKDVSDLGVAINRGGGHFSIVVLAPIILLVAIFIGTLASLRSPKSQGARGRIDRPRPPVDLPFD